MAAYRRVFDSVTCRLTAKYRDRVRATYLAVWPFLWNRWEEYWQRESALRARSTLYGNVFTSVVTRRCGLHVRSKLTEPV